MIDYFSLSGLPYVLAIFLLIWIFQPLATLLHEAGHAIFAYLSTTSPVLIRLGTKKSCPEKCLKLGSRISIIFNMGDFRSGSTEFENQRGRLVKILILLGGPLFSVFQVITSGFFLFFSDTKLTPWLEVAWVSWFCCNLQMFLRSVIPVHLRPTKDAPDGPLSDGLQIFQLLTNRKKNDE